MEFYWWIVFAWRNSGWHKCWNFLCIISWWDFIDMMIVIISINMCDQCICRPGFFLSTNMSKLIKFLTVLVYFSLSWKFGWFIICTFLTMDCGTTARAWVEWFIWSNFLFFDMMKTIGKLVLRTVVVRDCDRIVQLQTLWHVWLCWQGIADGWPLLICQFGVFR